MNADEERALAIVMIAAAICVVIAVAGLALGSPPTVREQTPPPPAIPSAPVSMTELRIVAWPTGASGPRTERVLRCPGATCPPARTLALIESPERRGPCPARRSPGFGEMMIEGRIEGRFVARFIEQRDPCARWKDVSALLRVS